MASWLHYSDAMKAMTGVERATKAGAMGWLVKAAALGLALAFSAGMAIVFELALDSTLLGG